MRVVPFVLVGALSLVAAACGAEPAGSSPTPVAAQQQGETVYGEPRLDMPALTVADVVARAAELEGKPVRVEGTIADVCAKRGCWIKLADETGPASVTFKVTDGVMVFPMSAKGKWAVADGTVRRFPQTLEQTRERAAHEAEEAGRSFDPASVTEPDVLVMLEGLGARVRESR